MTARDRKAVLAGDVVVRDIKRIGTNEIVSGAFLHLSQPFESAVAVALMEEPEPAPHLIAYRLFRVPLSADDWAGVRFDPSERDEFLKVLRPEPGLDLNLSTAEIESLRKRLADVSTDSPEAAKAASDAYREILLLRTQDYITRGLDGIQPYDRGSGKLSRPAEELRLVWEVKNDFLTDRFPAFTRAVGSFPEGDSPDVHHAFYWAKADFRSNPAFTLEHMTWQKGEDFLLLSFRQYYVGHTYNTQQTLALLLPDGDGTAALSAPGLGQPWRAEPGDEHDPERPDIR